MVMWPIYRRYEVSIMKQFDHIYDAMMSYVDDPDIQNEFETGECADLYDQCYDLRLSISRRLDGSVGSKNDDVLLLIDLCEKMQKILCRKCFQYGYAYGQKDSTDTGTSS